MPVGGSSYSVERIPNDYSKCNLNASSTVDTNILIMSILLNF